MSQAVDRLHSAQQAWRSTKLRQDQISHIEPGAAQPTASYDGLPGTVTRDAKHILLVVAPPFTLYESARCPVRAGDLRAAIASPSRAELSPRTKFLLPHSRTRCVGTNTVHHRSDDIL